MHQLRFTQNLHQRMIAVLFLNIKGTNHVALMGQPACAPKEKLLYVISSSTFKPFLSELLFLIKKAFFYEWICLSTSRTHFAEQRADSIMPAQAVLLRRTSLACPVGTRGDYPTFEPCSRSSTKLGGSVVWSERDSVGVTCKHRGSCIAGKVGRVHNGCRRKVWLEHGSVRGI